MVKAIGFIDYYLDEWHANNYPKWIHEATDGKMIVSYAYGMKDSEQGLSNKAWCEKNGAALLSTIEEVVEKSDYIIVLSPDNPEQHEALAQIPLQSGKPTYIDKTFAPDRNTAIRLFDLAAKHHTPLYSSSALRFAAEYMELEQKGIEVISSIGPGSLENYSIHQIEPIISLMGPDVARMMYTGTSKSPALLIQFKDGRQATIHHFGWECPFSMAINYESGSCKIVKPESNYFQLFMQNLITFFETGQTTVPASQTVAIITIIEYALKAAKQPYQWIELPQ